MHTPATEGGYSELIKNNMVILIVVVARFGEVHFGNKMDKAKPFFSMEMRLNFLSV
jgi:hypothetical protein